MRTPETIAPVYRQKRTLAGIAARLVWPAAILFAVLIESSCGDTFRPIAQPIPLPPPSPAAAHLVLSLSSNGSLDPGAISRIDVSGDSVASVAVTGVAPVHAAFSNSGTKVYIANSLEDTVSASSSSNPTQATTISLTQVCGVGGCLPSHPVFVNSTEAGRMYVANFGNGTISVINTQSDVVIATVAVDPAFAGNPNPIALAELPNGSKIYSLNQGSKSVSSISTLDDTVQTVIHFAAAPVWAVAGSDSAFVYVLDTSGAISAINTLSDTVTGSSSAGAGANYMFLDPVFDRLYVTNPVAGTVSIFDVAGNILNPHVGSPVSITAAPGSGCASAPMPTAVTVLGDGSRAYVASFQPDVNLVCTQATVIDSGTDTATSVISLPQGQNLAAQTGCDTARFRTFAASSGGGTNSNFKVYISQCDAGSVAVIDTFASNTGTNQHPADVLEATVPAPLSAFPPLSGPNPPSQNPVFVLAGP
jgi:YVTN family beta-propeller protein